MNKSTGVLTALTLLGLGALVWFFRPWLQPLAMLFYIYPALTQALVMLIAGGIIGLLAMFKSEGLGTVIWTVSGILALGVVLSAMLLNAPYTDVHLSQQMLDEKQVVDSMPDGDQDNPRILPRTVAEEYGENRLQEPRHRLGISDIAVVNGTPKWTMALEPDGLVNTFIHQQKGAVYADMTTESASLSFEDEMFDVGLGMQITDNLYWNLRKDEYWKNYRDPFVYQGENDEPFIATPIIDYEWHFRFPIMYAVPVYDGVAVTDTDGNMDYIQPEEVDNTEGLQDQRVYPYSLANRYVDSMQYRNGILNKWFIHEDQLQVADAPGWDNEQPFMVMTENGAELFLATEPFGDASGLFELWIVDGQTGEYRVEKLDRDSAMLGANRAIDYVRRAAPQINWADSDSDTGFEPVEPIPEIVDDQLYWQVRVVPLDSAGMAFTAFVDASDGSVMLAESDDEIHEFLEGEELEEVDPDTEPGQQPPAEPTPGDGEFELRIIEDGQVVDSIIVGSGQQIEIGDAE